MLRRFWRRIQQFFRRLLGIGRTTSPPRGSEENSLPPVEAKTSKPQRTDLEYEVIFSELLEGVNQGWSRGDTFGFLIGKRIDDAELIAWLHRFAENLQATPEQHQELARRMVLLGEVYGKELGKVAGEMGKRLLAQVPQLDDVPSGEVIEADVTTDDAEVWFEQGNQLLMKGDFQGAIASYDKALAIKPDAHEAWYNRGYALDDLGRIEEAIASYDKALAIKPDKHDAWINRGIAAGNSLHYYSQAATILQMQFPLSPVVLPNPTLNQRGYEGKLLCYQEGLKHCPQETHPQGWGELNHAIGKAHYFQRKNSQAVTSYNQALKTLTSDAFPELHLEVLQDLIKALLSLRRTPEAEQLKRDGTDLLRRLIDESKSQGKKEQLALKFASFQQLTVDIAIQSGQIIPALETAEAGKNACLTWLLYAYSDEIAFPNYAEIQQLLQPTTAIVYWHLSPAALTTFILKHGETPKTLETPETDFLNRLEKFEKWVKDWNQQYAEYGKGKKSETEKTSNWRDNLPEKLQQLIEILHIPKIESTLTGITHLILIPHRDLHRFPLHALFADKFTITYLPSAKIGLITQGKNPEKQHKLFSVEHPNSQGFKELEYAEIQSTAISQLFENPQRLSDNAATAQAIKTALASPYTIFHFTGHGEYDFFQPKKSYLALSGKDTLTLEEIFQIPLHPFRLVCLAACETAITGNQSITTEYIGLVSGFLSRKVTYVVSTLWTVESEASALIMMKFYNLLRQGEPEPAALKTAQKWLRQATWGDIQSFYAQTLASLPADADRNLRLLLEDALNRANTMEVDQQPFTHPYHWSAFTITGQA
ncbi:CHAT domain-containing protein [Aerosakkonemataceae cyanobacterium BLCC-F154]|uniref:CHAT domain-containing protein n=1 Tax=Floridaenema fluviatile BLCC-F154 TaxID=3153640 RepID=A0ABV4Y9L8_9CYAN